MERRQLVLALGLGVGTLGVGWAFLAAESAEEKIRRVVDELGQSVGFSEPLANPVLFGAQLNDRWQELLAPAVDVRVAEVASELPSARRELAFAAAQVLGRYGSLHVDFNRLDVVVLPQPTARGTVTVSALEGGEIRRDERTIEFGLVEEGGEFRVNRVQLGPRP